MEKRYATHNRESEHYDAGRLLQPVDEFKLSQEARAAMRARPGRTAAYMPLGSRSVASVQKDMEDKPSREEEFLRPDGVRVGMPNQLCVNRAEGRHS